MSKIFFYTIVLFLLITESLYAQGPNNSGTYYQAAEGKKGAELKTALSGIIYNRDEGGDLNTAYKALWTHFRTTDARADGSVWDMYSNLREMTFGDDQDTGSGNKEGQFYNREHSFPNSWFGGKVMPMYTDLHHIYPTDKVVNNKRDNYPFGETASPTYKSANDFSKLGSCSYPGYTGTVFEPNDEYKGDFARTYFYMVTCYEEKIADWYVKYPESQATLDGNTYPGLSSWQLNMLMEWAKNDPVSEKEINRNNAVYAIQKNRNPFIDYPGLEEFIWGDKRNINFRLGPFIDNISTDFDFYVYNIGEAELVRCKKKGIEGRIEIPSSITYDGKEYQIKRICDNAFEGCTNISEVVLPTALTYIGQESFKNCTALTTIVVPNNVNYIGIEAFGGCERLTTVELFTTNVPDIGQNAFPIKQDLYLYVPNAETYSGLYNQIKTIGFNSCEYVYSGEIPVLDIQNAPNTVVSTIDKNGMGKNAGTYHLPATFSHSSGITVKGSIPIIIKKKDLTIAADNMTKIYGDANPVFTASYRGFVQNENENNLESKPTLICSCNETSNVGDYDIIVDNAISKNYLITYNNGILTIEKAPLLAKVCNATKQYGNENPRFDVVYTGLKNEESEPVWIDNLQFLTAATVKSNVGKYEVTASGTPYNYSLTIESGIIEITPAPLTIKVNDATRQYYSDDPDFSYTCSGFVNNDNESVFSSIPTLSTSTTIKSNVGTYEIKVSETSSLNYSISYLNGTLTITPRTLMAFVENYQRVYYEDNPTFEVKYDGFVGGENENVLFAKATASTSATKTSDVGTYIINVAGGIADNYKFSYTSGVLTINKAEQTISWEQDLSALKVGDQVELKAVASSGLPITYLMDDNNIAEIYSSGNSKIYLDCKAEGQFNIRATQDGNKNYYSSTRVNKTVTIGNGESAIKTQDDAKIKIHSMPFGIRVLDVNVGDLIQVYSTDGILQKSVKVVEKITNITLIKNKIYIVKIGRKTMKIKY